MPSPYAAGFSGTLEPLVRPFLDVTAVSQPRVVQPPPAEEPEAFLAWGKEAQFIYENDVFREEASFRFRVIEEQSRVTETVRVENPNDPNQFVDVERIKQLTLKGGGLGTVTMTLNN